MSDRHKRRKVKELVDAHMHDLEEAGGSNDLDSDISNIDNIIYSDSEDSDTGDIYSDSNAEPCDKNLKAN